MNISTTSTESTEPIELGTASTSPVDAPALPTLVLLIPALIAGLWLLLSH